MTSQTNQEMTGQVWSNPNGTGFSATLAQEAPLTAEAVGLGGLQSLSRKQTRDTIGTLR